MLPVRAAKKSLCKELCVTRDNVTKKPLNRNFEILIVENLVFQIWVQNNLI
jgi:hypothetical protein